MNSFENKRKRLNLRLILGVLVLFVFTLVGGLYLYLRPSKIEKILESDSYSYLNKEAKNYIRDVYEETGQVVLTEKNKETNVPYLNPGYIEYLALSDEDREKVSLVPNAYVLDYVYTGTESSKELPSSYDLRNVDGKTFITPLKNQGNLGICWAFSALEQAESYLLVKNNKSYDSTSELFSVRQLDYATSTNGIKNYTNQYGRRELGGGGHFELASEIMSYGVSIVPESKMPMNYMMTQKELNEVLNYNNSSYEIEGTISIPKISRTINYDPDYYSQCSEVDDFDACYDELEAKLIKEYTELIKKSIMEYGGSSVGTTSPDGKCAFKNIDGSYVIKAADTCYDPYQGHAMQAIGWDDNYSYSYCNYMGNYSNVSNGTCSQGDLVNGKGAFILRNSWGESSPYAYAYLTYDSIYDGTYPASFNFISDLSSMSDRTWDNSYTAEIDYTKIYLAKRFTQTFEKKTTGDEKLEKIKVTTMLQNGNLVINIVSNGQTYSINSYKTNYPGIYTIDVSDKNIIISDDFSVTVSANDYYLLSKSVSAYTSNVDDVAVINTDDITSESVEFNALSYTKNISDNELISYSLYDGEDELVDYLEVTNNVVSVNRVNSTIKIVKKIENGTYTLRMSYGDKSYDANLILDLPYTYDGSGTVSDPYLIYTEEDLASIHDMGAYYKLANNIELTNNFIPIGTLDNPFTGGFDGSGYSISGLSISDTTLENSGLFGYVDNSTNTYIKNLSIKEPNISSNGDSGTLIGHLLVDDNETGTMLVDSIYVYGGSVSGNNAGALIGSISGLNFSGTNAYINNIFTSTTINGTNTSGVIGNMYEYQGVNVVLSNIQNIGIILSADSSPYSSHSSNLIGNSLSYYEVNNFIVTGFINGEEIFTNLIGGGRKVNGTNGIYIPYGISVDLTDEENNIHKVINGSALVDSNSYTNWTDFNTYWKMETIDGVNRMPVLKGVDFTYTSVDVENVKVTVDETILLNDYINPIIDTSMIDISVLDDSIAEVQKINGSIAIIGLKAGITTIHVVSNYDGFVGDIEVEVIANPIVYYHANDGSDIVLSKSVDRNTSFTLEKNTFERVGYIFSGWGTKVDGGTRYSDMASINGLNEDLNLYAQWSPIRYTVQYVYNFNGTSKVLNTQYFIYDSSANLMNYTQAEVGYKFSGWGIDEAGTIKYNGGEKVQNLTTEKNSVIKLYTLWEPISYNILFDSNGGNGTMENISATYGDKVELSTNGFSKEGYKFIGWNTKSDGSGTAYIDKSVVSNLATTDNSNVILYAQWSASDYLILFDSNGGSGTMSSIKVAYDQDVTLPVNGFEKEGYKFITWNTESDGSGTSYGASSIQKSLTSKENIVLYAIWEPISYSVLFNANGGSGFVDKISTVYGEDITLPSSNFVKVGYKFVS